MKRVVGIINKNTINKFNLPKKFFNKKIVLYSNDRRHCEKRHLCDFDNPKHFYYVMDNLEYIVDQPDFVYYYKKKDTIEYYRELGKNISIRIRIENSQYFKIKTVFPVELNKIEERKQRAIEDKYIVNR